MLGSINVYLSPRPKQDLNSKLTVPQLGHSRNSYSLVPKLQECTLFLDVASGLHDTIIAHNPEWDRVVGVHWIMAHPRQPVLEYTHLAFEQSFFPSYSLFLGQDSPICLRKRRLQRRSFSCCLSEFYSPVFGDCSL